MSRVSTVLSLGDVVSYGSKRFTIIQQNNVHDYVWLPTRSTVAYAYGPRCDRRYELYDYSLSFRDRNISAKEEPAEYEFSVRCYEVTTGKIEDVDSRRSSRELICVVSFTRGNKTAFDKHVNDQFNGLTSSIKIVLVSVTHLFNSDWYPFDVLNITRYVRKPLVDKKYRTDHLAAYAVATSDVPLTKNEIRRRIARLQGVPMVPGAYSSVFRGKYITRAGKRGRNITFTIGPKGFLPLKEMFEKYGPNLLNQS